MVVSNNIVVEAGGMYSIECCLVLTLLKYYGAEVSWLNFVSDLKHILVILTLYDTRKPSVEAPLVVTYLQFPLQVCFPWLSMCRPCPPSHPHLCHATDTFLNLLVVLIIVIHGTVVKVKLGKTGHSAEQGNLGRCSCCLPCVCMVANLLIPLFNGNSDEPVPESQVKSIPISRLLVLSTCCKSWHRHCVISNFVKKIFFIFISSFCLLFIVEGGAKNTRLLVTVLLHVTPPNADPFSKFFHETGTKYFKSHH